MPSPADPSGNSADDADSEVPRKAPIDQWLSGEMSTIEVIDRFLAFFGIEPRECRQRRKDDDNT